MLQPHPAAAAAADAAVSPPARQLSDRERGLPSDNVSSDDTSLPTCRRHTQYSIV